MVTAMNQPVSINAIQDARRVLRGVILATPVLPAAQLSDELGVKAFYKAENTQHSGSFKIRGAYNTIAHLTPEEKARGVIAPSAGNHAQGVALAARMHGVHATIVMPERAPLTKVVATRRLGADVVLHGTSFDDALAHARQLQAECGSTYIHAFDDPRVIAGQGTIGLELDESFDDLDTLVVPIGGGGLISGIAIALKTLRPDVRIVGVQALGCAPLPESLAAGHPITSPSAHTIADGIAVKRPGDLTLSIIRHLVDEVVTVTDEEIVMGIAHVVQNNRLVVEGAGAAGVAALMSGNIRLRPGSTVATVLCGGNIDSNLLARVLETALVRQGRYLLLRTSVDDRPGGLAGLVDHIAATGASVIDLFHRRAMWRVPIDRAGVEVWLEVRDEAHAQAVLLQLEQAGYLCERSQMGVWPG
jgi:threonine dehydratase